MMCGGAGTGAPEVGAANRGGPPRGLAVLRQVGPGLMVAATGVGAGDLVAATSAGARWGLAVLWAVALGALVKLALAEGVARWQLATGTTLLEGWFRHLGWPVRAYFLAFLAVWSVVVAAALMSACGLAAHALVPALSVRLWAVIHGVAAAALVWLEGYPVVERVMGAAVAVMVVTLVGAAALQLPPADALAAGLLVPTVPEGGAVLVAGVVGGVGGTVTLLAYGYWLSEKGWHGVRWLTAARVDLAVGYGLTAAFGLAVVILGSVVLHPQGVVVEGSDSVLRMADMLGGSLGRVGRGVFLVGFWAAVASSIVGVWQGVPYLFAHAVDLMRRRPTGGPFSRHRAYRVWLLLMAGPPMALLLLDRPVWLVIAYAALGSLFMPFLAATLLVLNSRRSLVGGATNGPWSVVALVACLVLVAALAAVELLRLVR